MFEGERMVQEDNIIRSTIYCPKYLHNKAKEAGVNISKELTSYLETILFGDNVHDVKFQMEQLRNKKKTLQTELAAVDSRMKELTKIMSEHDSKLVAEKNLFTRFCNSCLNHLRNAEKGNVSFDFKRVIGFWKKDYFGCDGMNEKIAMQIVRDVEKDCFSFDDFTRLRRGDSY